MSVIRSEIQINAPKEKVWEILANLGDIVKFHPFVMKSYYTSDQKKDVGASRYCLLIPDVELSEKAIEWKDGESFRVKTDIIGGKGPPVENMTNSLGVAGTEDQPLAYMEILYDLKEGAHQNRVDNEMQQIADGLTLGLKHYAESGIEVDMEVLKKLK